MNALVEKALDYAGKGLPVFPCNAQTKRPLTDNGFYDASADADQVRQWWEQWPNAMIGMPTGERTGFWVLDIDDPESFEQACSIDIPATRRVETGKGYHLYFRFDPAKPVRNAQKTTKGWPFPSLPGAETRGDGGYVIVPPSIHPSGREYRWRDDTGMAHAPAQLLKIVRKEARSEQAKPAVGGTKTEPSRAKGDSAYGIAALSAECDAIRDAGDGEQEGALNSAALKIGALVAGGELTRDTARNHLLAAGLAMPSYDGRDPWTLDAIMAKVDRGLSDGAANPRSAPPRSGVQLDDFRAYMPNHSYIFMPSGEMWPASSVNARLPRIPLTDSKGNPLVNDKGEQVEQAPNQWLDQNKPVEQVTWAPGEAQVVSDRLTSDGGWMPRPGCNVFNLYRPPISVAGDAGQAKPWVDHIRRVYPDDADHLIAWLAHRCQRPQEKINHAIVLGGSQGIGKDTILEPVKAAVGSWNFGEISPHDMFGSFNGFVKSIILRISEARDLGDVDRFAFYDRTKQYITAPPDCLRVNEKHMREYYVFNVCGVIITTNYKTDGIYLPPDDRRHYVAWSEVTRDEFPPAYWTDLYRWYREGGTGHVIAYLRTLDLSNFNPFAPPPKTPAFWDIVSANQAPEEAEMNDALDSLGWPEAVTISMVASAACESLRELLAAKGRTARTIPHRFEECGYAKVRNVNADDGLFRVNGKRGVIYARKTLSRREQFEAANRLIYPGSR
jgi:hypothetical protein